MNGMTVNSRAVLRFIGKSFIVLFCIPILTVWTAGSIVCAFIALAAAVLGALGWNGIAMNIYPGYSLPHMFSLPLGMILAFLLFLSFKYTRRSLRSCLRYIQS